MRFTKAEATGNDFILIHGSAPPEWSAKDVVRWCDRHYGVGADGLIFLQSVATGERENSWTWEFFNSDGSSAEMCGNAARGVAAWLSANGWLPAKLRTRAGWVALDQVGVCEFSVTVAEPQLLQKLPEGQLIDSGVPHLVVEIAEMNFEQRLTLASRLRSEMQNRGISTNITLLEIVTDDTGRVVTFERGVEGFTLSCGTGALAAAAHMRSKSLSQNSERCEARRELPGHEARRSHSWAYGDDERRRPGSLQPAAVAQSFGIGSRFRGEKFHCILPGGTLRVNFGVAGTCLEGPARIVYSGEMV